MVFLSFVAAASSWELVLSQALGEGRQCFVPCAEERASIRLGLDLAASDT